MSIRIRFPRRVRGVYAIHGPGGVYVGQSASCWERQTLLMARILGLDCGVIRQMPGASRRTLVRAEAEVAGLFESRGLKVVSQFSFPSSNATY